MLILKILYFAIRYPAIPDDIATINNALNIASTGFNNQLSESCLILTNLEDKPSTMPKINPTHQVAITPQTKA